MITLLALYSVSVVDEALGTALYAQATHLAVASQIPEQRCGPHVPRSFPSGKVIWTVKYRLLVPICTSVEGVLPHYGSQPRSLRFFRRRRLLVSRSPFTDVGREECAAGADGCAAAWQERGFWAARHP